MNNIDSMSGIKTLAFLSFATTGLMNPRKITEIALVCCSVRDFLQTEAYNVPRVLQKFVICCNPEKDIEVIAENLTGLNLAMLNGLQQLRTPALLEFLKLLPQPVCLISHNGMQFHYKILLEQLDTTDEFWATRRCDSLSIFREVLPGLRNYTLSSIYMRLFDRDIENSHSAGGNAEALMKCAIATKNLFMRELVGHYQEAQLNLKSKYASYAFTN